jgi:hypothetical protein
MFVMATTLSGTFLRHLSYHLLHPLLFKNYVILVTQPLVTPMAAKMEDHALQQPACSVCHHSPALEMHPSAGNYFAIEAEQLPAMTASAEAGCICCQILLAGLDLAVEDGDESHRYKSSTVCMIGRGNEHFYYEMHADITGMVLQVDAFTLPGERSIPKIRVAPLLPPSTKFQDSLGLIQQWLHQCQKEHPRCCEATAFLPERLLHVGSEGDDVCLVETQTLKRVSPASTPAYACLSHCWGLTRSKHITRRINLAANALRIPEAELPASFRDAISATRSLNIPYLWIDSLCIVQDDPEDWKIHVEAMADIYRNAFLTLAAGASVDDDGGLFGTTDPRSCQPKVLPILNETGDSIKVHVRLLPTHPNSVWAEPLEKRGWIFQERLLSRRFLCFAKDEVRWECLEDVACACSTTRDGFNPRQVAMDSKPAFLADSPTKWTLSRLQDLEEVEVTKFWRDLVHLYTKRRLTFAKDKLPALAGLAALFSVSRKDRYLFGHWEDDLKRELAWKRNEHEATPGRSERDVPSWSWAAAADGIDGGNWIYWDDLTEVNSPTDMGWDVVSVSQKALCLSGHITPLCLQVFDRDPFFSYLPLFHHCTALRWTEHDSTTQSDRVVSDKIVEKMKVGSKQRCVSPLAWASHDIPESKKNVASLYCDYQFWNHDEDLQQILTDVFFFDMGKLGERGVPYMHVPAPYTPVPDHQCWALGLVLRKRQEGLFERIGLMYVHTGMTKEEWTPRGDRQDVWIT